MTPDPKIVNDEATGLPIHQAPKAEHAAYPKWIIPHESRKHVEMWPNRFHKARAEDGGNDGIVTVLVDDEAQEELAMSEVEEKKDVA